MAKKAPELKRSMTAGQMEMISLGGAIWSWTLYGFCFNN